MLHYHHINIKGFIMTVQIHSKELTLTSHLNDHIAAAIENFKRYHLDITTVNVNIKKVKNDVEVEFDIHVGHAQPVIITDSDKNVDVAIDLAIDRANKALGRLHDKMKDHNATSLRDIELLETETADAE
jgi:putative sigma-54 modulation protein